MRKIGNLIKRNRLSNNRQGGIEGLPLQLIIVILIATLGTTVILGWMDNIETPQSIGEIQVLSNDIVLVNGETANGDVEVRVVDRNGNYIEGASVVITGLGVKTGLGVTPHVQTDNEGIASFTSLNISMKGSPIGYLTVNVSAPGYGEDNTTRITVIR
ncbi:MAG TPA: hypothetical protein VJX93_02615 [Candidatus Methanomethylophilaceae archaeon]|nr:hypothetical protein [Candidatus Methanomethylophilaceae archaeon]